MKMLQIEICFLPLWVLCFFFLISASAVLGNVSVNSKSYHLSSDPPPSHLPFFFKFSSISGIIYPYSDHLHSV